MPRPPRNPKPALTATDIAVLLLAGALLVALRAQAWSAPLETDECNYLYIGQRLVTGDRLYQDVWDHQPPLIFAFMAAATRLIGASEFAYRSLATAASLVSLVMVFAIAARSGHRAAGWLAAGLFALCSSDPGTAGEGGNRELFMNALILPAFWLLLLDHQRSRLARIGAAGLLIGLASAFKTVVAAHWLALMIWLGVSAWHRERRVARVAADKIVLTIGPLLVWLGTWAYFATTGRSGAFLDAVFGYNLGYSGLSASLWARFVSFFDHGEIFRSAWALWLAGAVGLVALPWRRKRLLSWGLAAMAAGSYVAICLPGRFWPHYYYLMLPWLAICAGILVNRLVGAGQVRGLAWVYAAALVVLLGYFQGRHYYLLAPDEIARFRYGVRMAWARDQGRRVAEVTDPEDTVYVYGSDAGIYYYAQRRCATRFTMIEAVSAERPGAPQRREQFMVDFRENRPRLVLVTEQPFEELYELLQKEYLPAGMDFGAGPDQPPRMQVLMDAKRPIGRIDWNWYGE